jgi:hypothetical protein
MVKCSLLCLLLTLWSPCLGAQNPILGAWAGTYRDQPPDGLIEPVRRFRLVFSTNDDELSALFYRLVANESEAGKVLKIQRVDPDGWTYCLDVEEEEQQIYAWNLTPEGDVLQGVRNTGPCTELGVGPGARFFRVDAKRMPPSQSDKASGVAEKH